MSSPGTAVVRWIGLAILGLMIAAAIAFAASKVVSQRVGLAGESFTAGRELAPPRDRGNHRGNGGRGHKPDTRPTTTTTPATTTTSTLPTTTAPAPTVPPSAAPQQPAPGSNGGQPRDESVGSKPAGGDD